MDKEQCISKYIQTIQRFFRIRVPISYNNTNIYFRDIRTFSISSRKQNDSYNRTRETIIGAIINNKVPRGYYTYSFRWLNLKEQVDSYLQTLCGQSNDITCIHKAGRTNHYDFKLVEPINQKEFHIEFKFNAQTIGKAPQFVSPINISEYLENCYIEFYYNNYLSNLLNAYDFAVPSLEDYKAQIQAPNPKCMVDLQAKYYRGCKSSSRFSGDNSDIEFYKKAKETSKKSIVDFISNNGLKIDILSEYLTRSQSEKHYMLYRAGKIYYQNIDSTGYELVSYEKQPGKQRYIATTKSGNKIKILLRWKNGNGIAFPAFQIS